MRLGSHERAKARSIVLRACLLMLDHKQEVHYSQRQSDRWEGITRRYRVVKGEYPHHADCSSTATWILWNALTHAKGSLDVPDDVNGLDWKYGNTASLRKWGYRIGTGGTSSTPMVGDLYHYGKGAGKHVAVYIGGGFVFSHGSEPGPYKSRWDYRRDFDHARRYILAPG